ncbi:FAD-dependent oxidoreductase [Leucobacter rhizosphaerae]|uniref:FAD-dependent oxidoreductase n=1 Tax=Leucobacter rhizosphaerae TaxID=2932245 RepID=A0ABY4FT25_9MICO|nr:FAD-dependent oxidoreductase [Leucobacter rhizosphaerae]UOQ59423.1 FAD-dependent oxidoreductase [Leucobacter rhizosphaerae]
MGSLWIDTAGAEPTGPSDLLEPGAQVDAVVVGAGLTGLTTALLLARAGRSVTVLESRTVGAVATGNTTGKLSLLQGQVASEILSHHSSTMLQAYVEGNREGQSWLLRYLESHGVPVQQRDAFTYAATSDGIASIDDEFEACRIAGLDVERLDDVGLPFRTRAGIRLADQAQFDPMDVLRTLADDVRRHGGTIVERTRVTGVRSGSPATVETSGGELFASIVVLATGTPILDRGLAFAKLRPLRSYAQAFRVPAESQPIPRGMYLSIDEPSRSLRTAPLADGEALVVGGNGHPVGRERDTAAKVADLEAWTQRHFPGAVRTHAWSAQDYEPIHRVPYVGWLPRSGRTVAYATGYNKWGMTNAVAAALSLAAEVLEGQMPWAETLRDRATTVRDLASGAALSAEVGGELAQGWVSAELHPLPEDPPAEGEGVVGNRHLTPAAVSTVDGRVCTVSATCPHLGGIVTWNSAERSWDCPLHGSRFDAAGRLLEGPATSDLEVL